ncbi:NADPH-dependent 7-cyano-7-deazaguanine reductase QueF [Oceanobacter mangrovi]|uniref:NADPH-dependent 7-cyano-7-deazaguanine reductase QueF n=1 Tax=Oceanobacter mangrovi TaxID=2862510 RepID=UPI001C8D6C01
MAAIDSPANPLGKQSEYKDEYDASLLFPIPRLEGRKHIAGFTGDFYGEDTWNGFEVSWLNPRGKPVVKMAEFRIPAASPNIIESKSFKLYLNSFNQSRYASDDDVVALMQQDLSAAAGADVKVTLLTLDTVFPAAPEAVCLDDLDIEVTAYEPDAGLLQSADGEEDGWFCSHLLKSNCPVTGQPDWGSLYVQYKGAAFSREGLLAYIVSIRQHQGFHEQCVEQIYADLMAKFAPERLLVCARYVRRGGLDINPVRSSCPCEGFPNFRLGRQ